MATCRLNDQNDNNIKFPNLTFLGVESPQHHDKIENVVKIKHVVYALVEKNKK